MKKSLAALQIRHSRRSLHIGAGPTKAHAIIARLRTFIGQVMTETSGFITPGSATC